jgi:hypothetical protein
MDSIVSRDRILPRPALLPWETSLVEFPSRPDEGRGPVIVDRKQSQSAIKKGTIVQGVAARTVEFGPTRGGGALSDLRATLIARSIYLGNVTVAVLLFLGVHVLHPLVDRSEAAGQVETQGHTRL